MSEPRGDAPKIEPFGDEAVLVTLGAVVDRDLNRRARRLAAALAEARDAGLAIGEPVLGYACVLVPYDLAAMGAEEAGDSVRSVVTDAEAGDAPPVSEGPTRVVEIPTRYGGTDGEDLDAVAAATGLTARQVVDLHAEVEYEVFLLGFAPGFAYLGTLPEAIAVPRHPNPRTRVPAGSVAIAERQTAVYPVETPGGWNIIGRTELVLWDPQRDRPALLAPGDRVRFVSVA